MVFILDDMKNILIKEAENYEKRSKIEAQNKNYDDAIALLFQAKENYEKAGLTGQSSIIIKEIVRLQSLKKEEQIQIELSRGEEIRLEINHKENLETKGTETLEKAYKLALKGELDDAIDMYNEAYNIFKKLNYDYECKQILWQINEIKEHQRWTRGGKGNKQDIPIKDIVSLSQAEKRRMKIQNQLTSHVRPSKGEPIKEILPTSPSESIREVKKPKLFQQIQERERNQQLQEEKEEELLKGIQDNRILKIREKQEKLRIIKQQKEAEEGLIKQANILLDQGNRSIKDKKYDDAKQYYLQSIKIFSSLGWNNQVKTLNQELRNIEIYKQEDEKKYYLEQQKRQLSEEKFQKRVSTAISEKERYREKQEAMHSNLPPEIKIKLEKAEFTKLKAQKEETTQNFSRALARYQYVLDLYKSIPKENFNASEEIKSLEKKISELKEKM